ncbi:hypothetical protein PgNI_05937 [Pyricularia grisea]|uniref:Uncharacterized protein n=1 Tax=Pyricularia grisea TaxID=148305 RepID=A0A6P8B596_PYRGI|nr:hypothetical protein PgNI_05937 [Pyricularia grisea]TLD10438.1 hypothetical protein PgNI_05937 [Pyricularia grisea]
MFAIGLLTIGAIPTTIGVAEAISAQKKQNAAQKEQAKFHLTAKLALGGRQPMEALVVLRDGKLWIDHQESPVEGHKFTGYYFTYPSEEQHKGLVSTISIDPPMLNWIYADKDTGIIKYGGRKETIGHVIGPWWWTADETFLTLQGNPDCFVAEEDPESSKWFVTLAGRGGSGSGGAANDGHRTNHRDRQDEDEEAEEDEDEPDYDSVGEPAEEDEDFDCGPRRVPIRLRRRMMLGMESKYVKNES